jgi:hypothetical protein
MHRRTEKEILDEYNELYGVKEPTPFTHPQLFNPLNPPEGYAYDEWHAFWYKLPTESQYRFEMAVVKISLWVTLGLMLWVGISAVYSFA